jgi:hypothetical protein
MVLGTQRSGLRGQGDQSRAGFSFLGREPDAGHIQRLTTAVVEVVFLFVRSPSSRHSYQPEQGTRQRRSANARAKVFLLATVSAWALMISRLAQPGLMPQWVFS